MFGYKMLVTEKDLEIQKELVKRIEKAAKDYKIVLKVESKVENDKTFASIVVEGTNKVEIKLVDDISNHFGRDIEPVTRVEIFKNDLFLRPYHIGHHRSEFENLLSVTSIAISAAR